MLILGLQLRNMRHLVTPLYLYEAREAKNATKGRDATAALRIDVPLARPLQRAHAMS